MENKDIIKSITRAKIEKMAEVYYPKTIHRDNDGSWYDVTSSQRQGFIVGMIALLQQLGRGDL